jgi:PAS domain S-box-containing protein
MKKRQGQAESPKKSTSDSLFDVFTDIRESALQGGDLKKSSTKLEVSLKTLTGASSVSVFLVDETGSRLHLFSSSDVSSIHSGVNIPIDHEPIASFRRSRHGIQLDRSSKYFASFRDSIFAGTMVDSIRVHPIRFGQEFLGILVAAFWGSGGEASEQDATDYALSAAAGQLSLIVQSVHVGNEQEMLKAKYETVLEQVDSIVFVFDLSDGAVLEANEAFFKSFGYERSDLKHLTLFDLVFEPREVVEANIKRAAKAGSVHFPSKLYKHRNGSPIEMEVRGTDATRDHKAYGIVTAVDMTEKRKVEEESELQRARYQNFIHNSAEGIWRMEFAEPVDITREKGEIAKGIVEKGVIAECNQALARMYGYDTPDELIGKHALDFIADLDVYTSSKLLFTERNFSTANIETIEKDRHGNIHYFENSYIGETSGNKLIRIWGIQRDITEKRRLQEQLRASENRYRNLVEQANDMVLVFNRSGEFVFANRRFFEQTSYSPEEIWGKSMSLIVHADDAEAFNVRIEEQFRSPDAHLRHTLRLLTKFHEERIVELSMTTLRAADRATGILAIGRDVTVEQSVKTALHESEEKYRSLVEHSLLAVLVIQDNLIVYANQTSSDLFETDMSLLQGNPLDAFIHPNDYVQIFEKFAKANTAPNKDVQFSVRAITSTGGLKSIEGWAAGITYMGRPAIQAAMVDVTETKKLEEQLIQSQKMESIGQLASGVAHDFNNLLGSIYGAIGILKEKYAPADSGLRKYVDILDSSAKRAAELTSQLLTFSRQRGSDVKPFRLNEIVNDAMKILIRSIGKNIKVEYSLDPTLQAIEADPSQIEGVVINLSINSRDAMPSGGILRIETSGVEFDEEIARQVPDARPGRYACISVSDTGVGMDDKTKRRIFEPFFTTKPIGKGTGLGLSIVYGIVKNHKGFINVYNEPGRGTTFKVYFPVTSKTPLDELKQPQIEVPRGSETILIIDDELTLLDLTKEILQGLGYKVITAEGALDGINMYTKLHEEIDMVILDMLMPEMTGNEVYPVLKGINPEVAVLLATGLSVGERVDEMISLGVNGIVGKPYSVSDLAMHVRSVLDSGK